MSEKIEQIVTVQIGQQVQDVVQKMFRNYVQNVNQTLE